MGVQWRCFWNSQYPSPLLDQLVARQVDLDLSKMCTPSSISLMIMDLDSLKSWFSSLFHLKGVPGCSNWRKRTMCFAAAKAYEAWLISPNQECTSVVLAGVGK